jgi:hypothetical protein
VAAAVFLVLALRWLVELRRTALAAKVPLTALDKVIAALPVAYTVICLLSAGAVGEYLSAIASSGAPLAWLPVLGNVETPTAIWIWAVGAAIMLATPPAVVFWTEGFFAKRLPDLVALGRKSVWATLTGVRQDNFPKRVSTRQEAEEVRWKKLLR